MATQSTRTSNSVEGPPVVSVSELTRRIQQTLGERFQSVWVSGELSDVSQPSSGHIYFAIKDSEAQMRGVIWRRTAEQIPFEMRDGLEVICQGRVDIYPPRGSYQLIVNQVEPVGEGALQLAFRQLQARLEKEGLFRPELKRPLPVFPRRVAVVTSPTSAAVRDFLQVVRRRWPHGRVLVVPARVQGEGAASELVRALGQIHNLRHRPDIVVLTRGGGSLEDLWAFNEERLVRAIHKSTIPIISAIGHEIDVTLSDLVADVRALTPTEAGERIATSRAQWLGQLSVQKERLAQGLRNHCRRAGARIDSLERRLTVQHPTHRIERWSSELQQQTQNLQREMNRWLVSERQRLATHADRLEALSPLAVLGRGYSITTDPSGSPLLSSQSVEAGDIIHTRLHAGNVVSRVESRETNAQEE